MHCLTGRGEIEKKFPKRVMERHYHTSTDTHAHMFGYFKSCHQIDKRDSSDDVRHTYLISELLLPIFRGGGGGGGGGEGSYKTWIVDYGLDHGLGFSLIEMSCLGCSMRKAQSMVQSTLSMHGGIVAS